ncbi:unnamed protein product [Amaranthus hypochondriacus]
MKELLGKLLRKKEKCSYMGSASRYSRINCDESIEKHESRRGYVPILVGNCEEEEEERFMVPLGWINHPSILTLLHMSAHEFGFQQNGVIQIPCKPHHFRNVIKTISCK